MLWYDEHIGKYEKPDDDTQMPYLSGEVVYKLRCSFLHEGNPDILNAKIKEECNQIDHFVLVLQPSNEFEVYHDSSMKFLLPVLPEYSEYKVNVQRLCLIIARTARGYYLKNKEKFNFFSCSVEWA